MNAKGQPIVLATDFSEPARNALDHAAVLAREAGADIHALHVNLVPAALAGEEDLPGQQEFAEALGKAAGKSLDELPWPDDIRVQNIVRDDFSPAHGILSYAEEVDAAMIVLGTHGRTGLSALMGSVASQVTRGAYIPVLVTGDEEGHRAHPEGIRQVLTATDLSEESVPGVRHAARFAREHGARLLVVHALEPQYRPPYASAVTQSTTDLELAQNALAEFLDAIGLPLEDVQQEVDIGPPDEVIATVAKRETTDLIVISPHTRSAITRFFLGSTSDRVLRTAPCPVLIYREPSDHR